MVSQPITIAIADNILCVELVDGRALNVMIDGATIATVKLPLLPDEEYQYPLPQGVVIFANSKHSSCLTVLVDVPREVAVKVEKVA